MAGRIGLADHLTLLNIYLELYKNDKLKFLKKDIFIKIDKQIKELKRYAKSINKKTYTYINKKYKLIDIEPYDKIDNNILYILGKSHKFNLIKNNSTVNFKTNSKAVIEFSKVTTMNKNKCDYAICHRLVNRFGRKLFGGVTQIPNFIKFTN